MMKRSALTPKNHVRIAACQVPEFLEDIDGAIASIGAFAKKAERMGVRLLCFPECFLQGYLLEKIKAERLAFDLSSIEFQDVLMRLPAADIVLVFGLIEKAEGRLFNTAVVVKNRSLVGRYRKTHLLHGEHIFTAGVDYPIFEINGLRFGINICYDINFSAAAFALSTQGAALILCPANNMMPLEKAEKFRHIHNEVRGKRSIETGLWLISSDVTGSREGRISYGPTAVIDPNGCVIAQVPLLAAGLVSADIPL